MLFCGVGGEVFHLGLREVNDLSCNGDGIFIRYDLMVITVASLRKKLTSSNPNLSSQISENLFKFLSDRMQLKRSENTKTHKCSLETASNPIFTFQRFL